MEPITLAGLVIAFGMGMWNKAGEDTFDALRGFLTERLQGTPTGRALAAGEDIDPQQVTIDVEAIAPDPELDKLVAKVNDLLAQNEGLKKQVEAAIAQAKNEPTITMKGESHDQSTFKQIGKVEGQNISF